MSADLLGDETDNRLDPEVAASAFPEYVRHLYI